MTGSQRELPRTFPQAEGQTKDSNTASPGGMKLPPWVLRGTQPLSPSLKAFHSAREKHHAGGLLPPGPLKKDRQIVPVDRFLQIAVA